MFRLLPLEDDRIQRFLESRYTSFSAPVSMGEVVSGLHRPRIGNANSEQKSMVARVVLSNQMDLTTEAQILV